MTTNKEKIKELCDEREALSIDCELKITFINNEIRELEIANRPKPVLHSKALTDPLRLSSTKMRKGISVKLVPIRHGELMYIDYMGSRLADIYIRKDDGEFTFSHEHRPEDDDQPTTHASDAN